MYEPKIGDSGIYKLKEPFHVLLTPQVIYTCRSIRTINDILATGSLVFEKYYQPFGINEAQYLQDAAKNICIIGLQAGTGEWVYVPQSFILQPPTTHGVKYSSIVLGVGLGAIPDELNLEALVSSVKEIVQSAIGVEPKIKAVLVSQPAFIDHEKHFRLEQARKAKITESETLYTKSQRLQSQVETLTKRISELEKYIVKHTR